MIAVCVVAELVKHVVEDLNDGEEVYVAVRFPKTELNLECFSYILSLNGRIARVIFGEKHDAPFVLCHDGLDQFGDFVEDLFCLLLIHPFQGRDLPHLVWVFEAVHGLGF